MRITSAWAHIDPGVSRHIGVPVSGPTLAYDIRLSRRHAHYLSITSAKAAAAAAAEIKPVFNSSREASSQDVATDSDERVRQAVSSVSCLLSRLRLNP